MPRFGSRNNDPRNQYQNHENPPAASNDQKWKSGRLETDRRLLKSAERSEAEGDVKNAQELRRLIGD